MLDKKKTSESQRPTLDDLRAKEERNRKNRRRAPKLRYRISGQWVDCDENFDIYVIGAEDDFLETYYSLENNGNLEGLYAEIEETAQLDLGVLDVGEDDS